ncbi:hypothetical protein Hte_008319 [Hypoxylon texense]
MKHCLLLPNSGNVVKSLDRSHTREIITHGWLEIGPHAALNGPLRETFKAFERNDLFYTSAIVRNRPADLTVLEAVGDLFCRGLEVSLEGINRLIDPISWHPRIVVDLPRYSFNHSIVYWDESRRSKAFRSRTFSNHPLLGTQMIDWNPLDAKWRFVIKKEEMTWISDHRLHGDIWYPAAGMVSMIIEAVKQLLPDDQFDFELRNISFTSPIVVCEAAEGTEIQVSMIPTPKAKERKDLEYQFRILVRRDDCTWDEVCDGTITPQRTRVTAIDVNPRNEEEEKRERAVAAYSRATSSCRNSLHSQEMYRKVDEDVGLQYGPAFQGLTDIHYDGAGQSHAKLVSVDDTVTDSKKRPQGVDANAGSITLNPAVGIS